jgi:hypothetical protein
VAFINRDRAAEMDIPKGYWPGPPELAVADHTIGPASLPAGAGTAGLRTAHRKTDH